MEKTLSTTYIIFSNSPFSVEMKIMLTTILPSVVVNCACTVSADTLTIRVRNRYNETGFLDSRKLEITKWQYRCLLKLSRGGNNKWDCGMFNGMRLRCRVESLLRVYLLFRLLPQFWAAFGRQVC